MNPSLMSKQWFATLLGIVNGLLYGVVSRGVLWVYAEYDLRSRIEEAERIGGSVAQVTYFQTKFPILLVWYAVLFALTSYLAHRYLDRWRRTPFLLWLIIGIGAIAVWNLLGLSVAGLDAWLRGETHSWRLVTSPYDTEHGLISLGVVLSVNCVFGVIVHLAAALYDRNEKLNGRG